MCLRGQFQLNMCIADNIHTEMPSFTSFNQLLTTTSVKIGKESFEEGQSSFRTFFHVAWHLAISLLKTEEFLQWFFFFLS